MFPFGANTPQEYNAYRAWSQQQQFPEYSDYMGGPTHPNPAFGDVGIATPYRGNSMGNVSIDPSLIDKLRKMGLISPYQQQNLGALDRFGSNSTTQDQWTRISAATGIPVNQVQSALWQAQGISNQYDPTFTSTKFQWDPLRNQLVQVPGTGPHTNTYSSSQGYYGGRPPSNPAGYAMSQGGGGYGGGYDQSYGYGGLPNYGGGGANFGGGAMPMSRTLGGINPTGAVPFPTPVTPAPVTPAPGIARGSITERLPYAPPGGRGFGQPATPLEIAAGAAPGARTRRGIGERVPRNLIGGRMFAG